MAGRSLLDASDRTKELNERGTHPPGMPTGARGSGYPLLCMSDPTLLATFAVLVVALVLFVSERIPADLTALMIPVALGVLGVLDPSEALRGFGNPAVLTVAGMFVLSSALVRSGAVAALGSLLQRVASKGERRAILGLAVLAAIPSALINNTLVVVVYIPAALALARSTNLAPSRLMLPLAYASILGGCCTVVGTSTNVLVASLLPQMAPDAPAIGFFEPASFGVVIVVVGCAYLVLAGPQILPVRRSVTTVAGDRPSEYVTEVQVISGSVLIGRSIAEAFTDPHPELRVIELVRGEEIIWPQREGLVIAEGDLILVRGRAEHVLKVGESSGAQLLPELSGAGVRARDVTLAELVITRTSPLRGRTVRDAMFRAVRGAGVMAVQRRGSHLRSGIADLVLREGDTILVQTESSRLDELRDTDDFILLEGDDESHELRRRAPLVLAITVGLILLAAFDIVHISILAIGAAGLLVLTKSLSMREAYRALDLSTLAVMAGTISLGVALDKSGGADLISGGIQTATFALGEGPLRAYAALAACWVLTNVLTCVVSNAAAATVVLPIAISTAQSVGVSERPFIMAVLYSASLALATPMGYQTNLLVWGPGGYRFSDYLRLGTPLQALLFIVAVPMVPMFFPF